MAKEIITTVEVKTHPERIWQVLIAFGEWPEWHPAILEFAGSAIAGQRLRFRAQSPERRRRRHPEADRPGCRPRPPAPLARALPRPGLVDETHEFALEPIDAGTRVTQRERFTGILVPLMRSILARTERDNTRADHALKARAESAA